MEKGLSKFKECKKAAPGIQSIKYYLEHLRKFHNSISSQVEWSLWIPRKMTPDQLPLGEFLEEADDQFQERIFSAGTWIQFRWSVHRRSSFRTIHTIKGAGMVMQSELSEHASS